MKKTLYSVALATYLSTQLFAGGDITPVEIVEPHSNIHHEESKYYIVVSGMMLLGDEGHHHGTILDGDNNLGYGFGIDVGYRLGNGFAVEYDFTYGRNDVYEIEDNRVLEKVNSEYYTSALDIVYTYEATHKLGIFAKTGYEYEWETIKALDVDEKKGDFVFGAGLEYAINKSYKVIVEYEYSLIEGPHGDAVLAGVMFNF